MTVEADLSLLADLVEHGLYSLLRIGQDHGPGGIHHVDAHRASVDHDARLLRQLRRSGAVRQHQAAHGLHAEFARGLEVLDGDVGLGAVCGDARDRRARVVRLSKVLDRAEARQHEHGDPCLLRLLHGCRDQLDVVDGAEAVVEA
jgi:hypothetical protein